MGKCSSKERRGRKLVSEKKGHKDGHASASSSGSASPTASQVQASSTTPAKNTPKIGSESANAVPTPTISPANLKAKKSRAHPIAIATKVEDPVEATTSQSLAEPDLFFGEEMQTMTSSSAPAGLRRRNVVEKQETAPSEIFSSDVHSESFHDATEELPDFPVLDGSLDESEFRSPISRLSTDSTAATDKSSLFSDRATVISHYGFSPKSKEAFPTKKSSTASKEVTKPIQQIDIVQSTKEQKSRSAQLAPSGKSSERSDQLSSSIGTEHEVSKEESSINQVEILLPIHTREEHFAAPSMPIASMSCDQVLVLAKEYAQPPSEGEKPDPLLEGTGTQQTTTYDTSKDLDKLSPTESFEHIEASDAYFSEDDAHPRKSDSSYVMLGPEKPEETAEDINLFGSSDAAAIEQKEEFQKLPKTSWQPSEETTCQSKARYEIMIGMALEQTGTGQHDKVEESTVKKYPEKEKETVYEVQQELPQTFKTTLMKAAIQKEVIYDGEPQQPHSINKIMQEGQQDDDLQTLEEAGGVKQLSAQETDITSGDNLKDNSQKVEVRDIELNYQSLPHDDRNREVARFEQEDPVHTEEVAEDHGIGELDIIKMVVQGGVRNNAVQESGARTIGKHLQSEGSKLEIEEPQPNTVNEVQQKDEEQTAGTDETTMEALIEDQKTSLYVNKRQLTPSAIGGLEELKPIAPDSAAIETFIEKQAAATVNTQEDLPNMDVSDLSSNLENTKQKTLVKDTSMEERNEQAGKTIEEPLEIVESQAKQKLEVTDELGSPENCALNRDVSIVPRKEKDDTHKFETSDKEWEGCVMEQEIVVDNEAQQLNMITQERLQNDDVQEPGHTVVANKGESTLAPEDKVVPCVHKDDQDYGKHELEADTEDAQKFEAIATEEMPIEKGEGNLLEEPNKIATTYTDQKPIPHYQEDKLESTGIENVPVEDLLEEADDTVDLQDTTHTYGHKDEPQDPNVMGLAVTTGEEALQEESSVISKEKSGKISECKQGQLDTKKDVLDNSGKVSNLEQDKKVTNDYGTQEFGISKLAIQEETQTNKAQELEHTAINELEEPNYQVQGEEIQPVDEVQTDSAMIKESSAIVAVEAEMVTDNKDPELNATKEPPSSPAEVPNLHQEDSQKEQELPKGYEARDLDLSELAVQEEAETNGMPQTATDKLEEPKYLVQREEKKPVDEARPESAVGEESSGTIAGKTETVIDDQDDHMHELNTTKDLLGSSDIVPSINKEDNVKDQEVIKDYETREPDSKLTVQEDAQTIEVQQLEHDVTNDFERTSYQIQGEENQPTDVAQSASAMNEVSSATIAEKVELVINDQAGRIHEDHNELETTNDIHDISDLQRQDCVEGQEVTKDDEIQVLDLSTLAIQEEAQYTPVQKFEHTEATEQIIGIENLPIEGEQGKPENLPGEPHETVELPDTNCIDEHKDQELEVIDMAINPEHELEPSTNNFYEPDQVPQLQQEDDVKEQDVIMKNETQGISVKNLTIQEELQLDELHEPESTAASELKDPNYQIHGEEIQPVSAVEQKEEKLATVDHIQQEVDAQDFVDMDVSHQQERSLDTQDLPMEIVNMQKRNLTERPEILIDNVQIDQQEVDLELEMIDATQEVEPYVDADNLKYNKHEEEVLIGSIDRVNGILHEDDVEEQEVAKNRVQGDDDSELTMQEELQNDEGQKPRDSMEPQATRNFYTLSEKATEEKSVISMVEQQEGLKDLEFTTVANEAITESMVAEHHSQQEEIDQMDRGNEQMEKVNEKPEFEPLTTNQDEDRKEELQELGTIGEGIEPLKQSYEKEPSSTTEQEEEKSIVKSATDEVEQEHAMDLDEPKPHTTKNVEGAVENGTEQKPEAALKQEQRSYQLQAEEIKDTHDVQLASVDQLGELTNAAVTGDLIEEKALVDENQLEDCDQKLQTTPAPSAPEDTEQKYDIRPVAIEAGKEPKKEMLEDPKHLQELDVAVDPHQEGQENETSSALENEVMPCQDAGDQNKLALVNSEVPEFEQEKSVHEAAVNEAAVKELDEEQMLSEGGLPNDSVQESQAETLKQVPSEVADQADEEPASDKEQEDSASELETTSTSEDTVQMPDIKIGDDKREMDTGVDEASTGQEDPITADKYETGSQEKEVKDIAIKPHQEESFVLGTEDHMERYEMRELAEESAKEHEVAVVQELRQEDGVQEQEVATDEVVQELEPEKSVKECEVTTSDVVQEQGAKEHGVEAGDVVQEIAVGDVENELEPKEEPTDYQVAAGADEQALKQEEDAKEGEVATVSAVQELEQEEGEEQEVVAHEIVKELEHEEGMEHEVAVDEIAQKSVQEREMADGDVVTKVIVGERGHELEQENFKEHPVAAFDVVQELEQEEVAKDHEVAPGDIEQELQQEEGVKEQLATSDIAKDQEMATDEVVQELEPEESVKEVVTCDKEHESTDEEGVKQQVMAIDDERQEAECASEQEVATSDELQEAEQAEGVEKEVPVGNMQKVATCEEAQEPEHKKGMEDEVVVGHDEQELSQESTEEITSGIEETQHEEGVKDMEVAVCDEVPELQQKEGVEEQEVAVGDDVQKLKQEEEGVKEQEVAPGDEVCELKYEELMKEQGMATPDEAQEEGAKEYEVANGNEACELKQERFIKEQTEGVEQVTVGNIEPEAATCKEVQAPKHEKSEQELLQEGIEEQKTTGGIEETQHEEGVKDLEEAVCDEIKQEEGVKEQEVAVNDELQKLQQEEEVGRVQKVAPGDEMCELKHEELVEEEDVATTDEAHEEGMKEWDKVNVFKLKQEQLVKEQEVAGIDEIQQLKRGMEKEVATMDESQEPEQERGVKDQQVVIGDEEQKLEEGMKVVAVEVAEMQEPKVEEFVKEYAPVSEEEQQLEQEGDTKEQEMVIGVQERQQEGGVEDQEVAVGDVVCTLKTKHEVAVGDEMHQVEEEDDVKKQGLPTGEQVWELKQKEGVVEQDMSAADEVCDLEQEEGVKDQDVGVNEKEVATSGVVHEFKQEKDVENQGVVISDDVHEPKQKEGMIEQEVAISNEVQELEQEESVKEQEVAIDDENCQLEPEETVEEEVVGDKEHELEQEEGLKEVEMATGDHEQEEDVKEDREACDEVQELAQHELEQEKGVTDGELATINEQCKLEKEEKVEEQAMTTDDIVEQKGVKEKVAFGDKEHELKQEEAVKEGDRVINDDKQKLEQEVEVKKQEATAAHDDTHELSQVEGAEEQEVAVNHEMQELEQGKDMKEHEVAACDGVQELIDMEGAEEQDVALHAQVQEPDQEEAVEEEVTTGDKNCKLDQEVTTDDHVDQLEREESLEEKVTIDDKGHELEKEKGGQEGKTASGDPWQELEQDKDEGGTVCDEVAQEEGTEEREVAACDEVQKLAQESAKEQEVNMYNQVCKVTEEKGVEIQKQEVAIATDDEQGVEVAVGGKHDLEPEEAVKEEAMATGNEEQDLKQEKFVQEQEVAACDVIQELAQVEGVKEQEVAVNHEVQESEHKEQKVAACAELQDLTLEESDKEQEAVHAEMCELEQEEAVEKKQEVETGDEDCKLEQKVSVKVQEVTTDNDAGQVEGVKEEVAVGDKNHELDKEDKKEEAMEGEATIGAGEQKLNQEEDVKGREAWDEVEEIAQQEPVNEKEVAVHDEVCELQQADMRQRVVAASDEVQELAHEQGAKQLEMAVNDEERNLQQERSVEEQEVTTGDEECKVELEQERSLITGDDEESKFELEQNRGMEEQEFVKEQEEHIEQEMTTEDNKCNIMQEEIVEEPEVGTGDEVHDATLKEQEVATRDKVQEPEQEGMVKEWEVAVANEEQELESEANVKLRDKATGVGQSVAFDEVLQQEEGVEQDIAVGDEREEIDSHEVQQVLEQEDLEEQQVAQVQELKQDESVKEHEMTSADEIKEVEKEDGLKVTDYEAQELEQKERVEEEIIESDEVQGVDRTVQEELELKEHEDMAQKSCVLESQETLNDEGQRAGKMDEQRQKSIELEQESIDNTKPVDEEENLEVTDASIHQRDGQGEEVREDSEQTVHVSKTPCVDGHKIDLQDLEVKEMEPEQHQGGYEGESSLTCEENIVPSIDLDESKDEMYAQELVTVQDRLPESEEDALKEQESTGMLTVNPHDELQNDFQQPETTVQQSYQPESEERKPRSEELPGCVEEFGELKVADQEGITEKREKVAENPEEAVSQVNVAFGDNNQPDDQEPQQAACEEVSSLLSGSIVIVDAEDNHEDNMQELEQVGDPLQSLKVINVEQDGKHKQFSRGDGDTSQKLSINYEKGLEDKMGPMPHDEVEQTIHADEKDKQQELDTTSLRDEVPELEQQDYKMDHQEPQEDVQETNLDQKQMNYQLQIEESLPANDELASAMEEHEEKIEELNFPAGADTTSVQSLIEEPAPTAQNVQEDEAQKLEPTDVACHPEYTAKEERNDTQQDPLEEESIPLSEGKEEMVINSAGHQKHDGLEIASIDLSERILENNKPEESLSDEPALADDKGQKDEQKLKETDLLCPSRNPTTLLVDIDEVPRFEKEESVKEQQVKKSLEEVDPDVSKPVVQEKVQTDEVQELETEKKSYQLDDEGMKLGDGELLVILADEQKQDLADKELATIATTKIDSAATEESLITEKELCDDHRKEDHMQELKAAGILHHPEDTVPASIEQENDIQNLQATKIPCEDTVQMPGVVNALTGQRDEKNEQVPGKDETPKSETDTTPADEHKDNAHELKVVELVTMPPANESSLTSEDNGVSCTTTDGQNDEQMQKTDDYPFDSVDQAPRLEHHDDVTEQQETIGDDEVQQHDLTMEELQMPQDMTLEQEPISHQLKSEENNFTSEPANAEGEQKQESEELEPGIRGVSIEEEQRKKEVSEAPHDDDLQELEVIGVPVKLNVECNDEKFSPKPLAEVEPNAIGDNEPRLGTDSVPFEDVPRINEQENEVARDFALSEDNDTKGAILTQVESNEVKGPEPVSLEQELPKSQLHSHGSNLGNEKNPASPAEELQELEPTEIIDETTTAAKESSIEEQKLHLNMVEQKSSIKTDELSETSNLGEATP